MEIYVPAAVAQDIVTFKIIQRRCHKLWVGVEAADSKKIDYHYEIRVLDNISFLYYKLIYRSILILLKERTIRVYRHFRSHYMKLRICPFSQNFLATIC
jgi:hypothetical protein